MEKRVVECFCGGKADLKFEDIHLKNSEIVLKHSGFYKCRKCKEEFATSEQMYEVDRKLKAQMKLTAKA